MTPPVFRKAWLGSHGETPMAIAASKIPQAIHDLECLIGEEWVANKVGLLKSWKLKESSHREEFLFHKPPSCNPLVPFLAAYKEWVDNGCPSDLTGHKAKAVNDLANLAGSVFAFEGYWQNVKGGHGIHHIRQTLRQNPRGMLAEFLTAVHFVQAGAIDVLPRFVDPFPTEDKSDILVNWGGVTIEVHCKSVEPGSGYPVQFDVFDYWAGCFLRDAEYYDCKRHVCLQVSGKLKESQAVRLRGKLKSWIASGLLFENVAVEEGITASCRQIVPLTSGWNKRELDKLQAVRHYRAVSAWKAAGDGKYRGLSILDVIPTKRPTPLSSLSAELKKAKSQSTGKRPAIVTIHMFEPVDVGFLATSPKAALVARGLVQKLADENGKKISALVLTSEPTREALEGVVGAKTYPSYWLVNPDSRFPLPPGLLPNDS